MKIFRWLLNAWVNTFTIWEEELPDLSIYSALNGLYWEEGVTESGIFYLEKIREVVREHVIADCALNTEIVAASLGNKAGFIGAASLILK